jgi:hypothetical protein
MTNQRIVPYPSSVGIVVYAMTAVAQNATDSCKPTRVIPLTANEPAAKIVIDPPLAEPLASRGVAIVQYCAQNLHIAPAFGLGGPTPAGPRSRDQGAAGVSDCRSRSRGFPSA